MNENSIQKLSDFFQSFWPINIKDKQSIKENLYKEKIYTKSQKSLKITNTNKESFSNIQSINNIYNINNNTNNIHINNINNNNICHFQINKSPLMKKSNIEKKIRPNKTQTISAHNQNLNLNLKNNEKQSHKINLFIKKDMNVEKLNDGDLKYRNTQPNFKLLKSTKFGKLFDNQDCNIFNDFSKKLTNSAKNNINNTNPNKIKNKLDIISIPCMNCGNLIELDKIEKHSLNCVKVSKDILSIGLPNKEIYNINYKLKKLNDYMINIEKEEKSNNMKYYITALKEYIEKTLNINKINVENIRELKNISKNFTMLNIHKKTNSLNFLILIDRAMILIQEKIKIFKNICKAENIRSSRTSLSQKHESEFENRINNKKEELDKINLEMQLEKIKVKNLRNSISSKSYNSLNNIFINNGNSNNNNSSQNSCSSLEISFENNNNETLENNSNSSKKNKKKLFFREVVRIKFEKLHNSHRGQKIPLKMIWEEAIKNNVHENNWESFILEELNNPKKYDNIIRAKKQKYHEMSIINEE